jgi:hypothetical protein
MANVPGTSGPVDYPNRPEGGPWGGENAGEPLPGGTARWPEPSPANMPTPHMGAGVPGTSGLTPNPGEPTDGTVQKGYKGDGYVKGGGDAFQTPANSGNEFETGGANASTAEALNTPTSFTKASTNQG